MSVEAEPEPEFGQIATRVPVADSAVAAYSAFGAHRFPMREFYRFFTSPHNGCCRPSQATRLLVLYSRSNLKYYTRIGVVPQGTPHLNDSTVCFGQGVRHDEGD